MNEQDIKRALNLANMYDLAGEKQKARQHRIIAQILQLTNKRNQEPERN